MLHSTQSGCTVAQSILRFNQIKAGRRLVGLSLGLALLMLGGGALAKAGTQSSDSGPDFGLVQGWVKR
ncbi:hypothetical protein C7293_06885 [filamentous cyanobacterium CCT1]|nr:hypothetical protein C7293_06885 [filamentous cyanobacterium CCT1]PSN80083.1 hypothetical protein C8B47_08335 [filamentous cyanobacterium CCP4]